MKLTTEQLNALAEEAMHLAFAHLAEKLDPTARHDLGGFFGYQAEHRADAVRYQLYAAAALADDHINS